MARHTQTLPAPTRRRPYPVVDRRAVLLELATGKRVLHLGCTNAPYTQESLAAGTHLHVALAQRCVELWGLDSDREGLDELRRHGYQHLIEADLEALAGLRDGSRTAGAPGTAGTTGAGRIPSEGFDVVIAGEIIEHLANPGRFLAEVGTLLAPGGVVVFTTVNAYCGFRFAVAALRGRGGAVEPVHPDHVAYYSRATLSVLLQRFGFRIDRFFFYEMGPEHRPHARRIPRLINDVCTRLAPQLSDGIIAVCSLPPAG